MPMVNQECNYVNHFDLETTSTPSSKKSIQPYQIGLKLWLEDIIFLKELGIVSIISFVYPPFSL
jgi:hypothetical protein